MNLLTVKEVSESLRVSEKTVMRLITSGQLSAGKIGKTWRIEAGDLSTYFKSRSIISRKQLKKAS